MKNTISIKDGGYICNDERVDKVWATGSASIEEKDISVSMHLLMKNGDRWDSERVLVIGANDNTWNEKLISQAEQYLSTLNQKIDLLWLKN